MHKLLYAVAGLLISWPLHAQDARPLSTGDPVAASITGQETHDYAMSLKADHFVFGYADQKSVDVIVRIIDPSGEQIAVFDDPARGPEMFQFKSTDSGAYRIEISPFQEQSGDYEIVVQRIEPRAATKSGRVDQLLAPYDRKDAPGVAIAVVENGADVYGRGFGMANLEYQQPITTSTVFDIASVSKQFGAMAIALLAEEGKLRLDDDVRTHWPEFPDFDDTVKIRHLVHHTSGLRDWPATLAIAGVRMDDVISFDQILRMVRHQQELNFTPGAEYSYSNTGYNVLAKIVEEVTGQSFREWTDEHLFEPLGMDNTHFQDNHQRMVEQRAYGYAPADHGYAAINNGLTALASSSLFTTTDDLVEWVKNYDKLMVGNAGVMDMVHTKGVLNDGEEITYAFGQGISEYKGVRRVQHSGSWAGFRTYLARFPGQGLAVIVLSNMATTNATGLGMQIAEIYLEDVLVEATDEAADETAAAEASEEAVPGISQATMERLVGTWGIEDGPTLSIVLEDEQLFAQIEGQPQFRLIPVAANKFKVDVPNIEAAVSFELAGSGKVQRGTVHQGGDTPIRRIDRWDPDKADLAEFAGRYYNAELETFYTLTAESDHLRATHIRNQPIELRPKEKDAFEGSAWFFRNVDFERNDSGKITGMRVSSGRVRNVLFVKTH